MDLFSSDEFMAIIKAEQDGHEDLTVLCTGLCKLYCNHDADFMKAWLKMPCAESPLLEEIADAVDRVHNIARCFTHLLCLELPEGEAETSFSDVQRLSKYAGKQLCERVLRDAILKSGSSWASLVEDVTKTAGKAALLGPERAEMEQFLKSNIPLNHLDLEKGIKVYKKLQASMRKIELDKVDASLQELLQLQARHILERTSSETSSCEIDQVLVGLNIFSATPGILSLVQELQDFMTQNRAALALSDLQSIIQADEEKTIDVSDFGNIKHLVSKCDPNAAGLPEELSDKVDDMLKRMLQRVLDEACCMLMFSVISSRNKKY